ncbi:hypothetical protein BFU36_02215 [Sulfolobus sp. A20]|uniref:hypothetical protein n=1 Tax=Sulfolobaceae TaxID=118883 RepID=UPI0008461F7D|nr:MULTISPECIES: hypothetical protein [unclassified Sulfolobus]TRM78297.1 hypothetical protein DJ532_01800 [Sulfolobus sp. A20-N-F8]TRM80597.1 hypothetical protein DJ531_12055 [Sulfolobus sp. A20-N-F6]TRM81715.1 hypothetical protein DJ524_03080 [Sulfolobus sp. D5]TRM81860.1 hypothetical protein DJ522_07645 [Sulfolobus sp. F3]TRM88064.1 hypothetical protein DJ529_06375 [Sulfolobus sp. C3]TRM91301.1 hypothetical protein DJ526_06845 [Sulfolobus sp. A20-N-G8]TRM99681.1 hypothetical protein DJ530
MEPIKVKLSSGREVEINDDIVAILNEYVRTQITLEELAKRIGLSGWEEAYELIKTVPAWIMWTPLPVYKKLV